MRRLLPLLLFAALATRAVAQFIHASGTHLDDGQGRTILLRGVNLGCWLYFEPWMMGAGEFSAWSGADGTADQFQTAVTELAGASAAASFWTKFRQNMVTEADIQAIAKEGFNCVRVPVDYRLFYDSQTGVYLTANYGYLDNLLAWCTKNHVYAIIDMHTVPGSQNIYNNDSVFVNKGHQDVLENIWRRIAARYAGSASLAGYDLMNEPVVNGDPSLRNLYIALTSAIRSEDRHHAIFVEGDWYASQLWLLGAPWDTNLVYSDHNYASTLPNGLPTHEDQATLYNAPLWMGEFGYNSNTWNAQQETELNAHNLVNGRSIQANWTLWAWKANAIWSPLNVKIPQAYQAVLNYWSGNGPRPSFTMAIVGLTQFVEATKFQNCAVNHDVVDAYTRSDFLSQSKPFTGQAIPGRIDCVDYDMGPEGIAFHDDLSSNTGGMGSGFEPWNNGWTARNDGVDITTAPDGYAVGWTDSGEWLNYTVSCVPGTYTLTIRYSGPGGTLHLSQNGVNLTGTVSLPEGPNGGDWNSFGTFSVPNVQISATGLATLQIYEESGGYNLEWISLTP